MRWNHGPIEEPRVVNWVTTEELGGLRLQWTIIETQTSKILKKPWKPLKPWNPWEPLKPWKRTLEHRNHRRMGSE